MLSPLIVQGLVTGFVFYIIDWFFRKAQAGRVFWIIWLVSVLIVLLLIIFVFPLFGIRSTDARISARICTIAIWAFLAGIGGLLLIRGSWNKKASPVIASFATGSILLLISVTLFGLTL